MSNEVMRTHLVYQGPLVDLLSAKDAHARNNCRDLNGTEPWACCNCDCTSKLKERLAQKGEAFLGRLRSFRSEMLRMPSCRFQLNRRLTRLFLAKSQTLCTLLCKGPRTSLKIGNSSASDQSVQTAIAFPF
jgi:hypothetical protein